MRVVRVVLLSCLIAVLSLPAVAGGNEGEKAAAIAAMRKLPITFEPNAGQFAEGVDFVSRIDRYTFALSGTEATTIVDGSEVRMLLSGAAQVAPKGEDARGATHYYRGRDPKKWLHDVRSYSKVRYDDVYDGIDLVYYGNGTELEYDFVVEPGADPRRIALQFDGIEAACLDAKTGDLVLATAAGELRHRKPYAYQLDGAKQVEVAASFTINDDGAVQFALGDYDESRPLIVDPAVLAIYGITHDIWQIHDMTVDANGYVYVVGSSTLVAAVRPWRDRARPEMWNNLEAVLYKINVDANELIWAAYIGGDEFDHGYAVAVDASSNVAVVGATESNDFPTTAGAFQAACAGCYDDGYVVKLASDGSLVAATLFAGSKDDAVNDVAFGPSGEIVVTGSTQSLDFPVDVNTNLRAKTGYIAAFTAKFSGDLQTLGFSRVLATDTGIGSVAGYSVAVNGSGEVLTGGLAATTIPTVNALQPDCTPSISSGSCSDAFLAKYASDGSPQFVTYVGGGGNDSITAVAFGAGDEIWFGGGTDSPNLPLAGPVAQATLKGFYDAFIGKLDATGSTLLFTTYLGGDESDSVQSLVLEPGGNMLAAGTMGDHENFPFVNPVGYDSGWVARFSSSGSLLVNTGFGRPSVYSGTCWVAVTPGGAVYSLDDDHWVRKLDLSASSPPFTLTSVWPKGMASNTENTLSVWSEHGEYPADTRLFVGGVEVTPLYNNGDYLSGQFPAGVSGVLPVTVQSASEGYSFTMPNAVEVFTGPLSVTGVNPNSILSGSAEVFSVYGTGFRRDCYVSLSDHNVDLMTQFISSSELRVTLLSTGLQFDVMDVKVRCTTTEVVLTDALTLEAKGIWRFFGTEGPSTGGSESRIALEWEQNGPATVKVGGVDATITAVSNNVSYLNPPHAAGRVDVEVTLPAGSFTIPQGFVYYDPVSVASVSPEVAPQAGGTTFTITGAGFKPGSRVLFDGTLATATFVDSTTLQAIAPPHPPGDVKITVMNPDGAWANIPFVYSGPWISNLTPTATVSQNGGTVSIIARGIDLDCTVTLDGVPVTVTSVQPYLTSGIYFKIDVIAPAHTPAKVDVVVTNPTTGEYGTLRDGLEYLGPAPDITGVSPSSGPAAGGTNITITGTNFRPYASVTVGGFYATNVVVLSDTTITATTPYGSAGPRDVVVRNIDRQASTEDDAFTYVLPPAMTTVAPVTGPDSGGTTVTITGTNFVSGATVKFDTTDAASVTFDSATQLTVVTPAHAKGFADVVVTNPDGQVMTLADAFRFLPPPPTVDSFDPTHAAPGNPVTITGTNFDAVQSVVFNTKPATVFTVDSDTSITATLPSGATDGAISVTTLSGTGTSTGTFTVDPLSPGITSFTPAGGPVGAEVTITGTQLSGVTSVKFNTTSASFIIDSATQIRATVPSGVTTGPITLTNAFGSATSETNFIVAPGVGTFMPVSGEPGTTVTISGTNLGDVTAVSFNGTAAASFTVLGLTQIQAVVPEAATTGPISVTSPGGTSASTANFTVKPTIASFSPAFGAPGASIVITGARLTGATTVKFAHLNASSFTVDSDTQITAVVPNNGVNGKISVTTPAGTSTSATDFLVTARVTGFSPSSGIPGATITVNGANFTGATNVTFNGLAAASFEVNSATKIYAVVPAGATTGPIAVTTAAGTATSTSNFKVAPVVTSFSPEHGAPGTVVTITGERFTGATAVKFNGVTAPGFSVSGGGATITVSVPSTATTGPISVTTPDGTGTSAASFTVTPRISSFSPSSALPGATIVIKGANFAGASAVTFHNAQAASTFTVNASGTQITVIVPAAAVTGPVVVTTPVGTATSTTNFGVLPAVDSFTPAQGEAGTSVVITGVRLTGATAVKFGGTSGGSATFTVNGDTQITATVPSNGKSGTICVTTPGGTNCSATTFSMPPRITDFDPNSALPGAAVTIDGVNFHDATAVSFHNGVSQPAFTVNAAGTVITTTVPAGAITGPVTVTTPIGTTVSTIHFGVLPAVTSFTPADGDVGTVVTITGERFTGATAVKFGGTSGGSATAFTVDSDTQISATVPSSGKSGTICVTTPGGTSCSVTLFKMPPRITDFDPNFALPGANVTIDGANFHDATAVSFHNGANQPVFTVNTAGTVITTTVPLDAITGPVTVTTPYGTTTSALHFGVLPEVTSFDPQTGDVGTVVTITGKRFTGATAVKFGGTSGVAATVFNVVNDLTITAEVPAAPKSGTICVTTPGGTSCSSGTFTVPPRITTFSPASALPGANVTVNGFNFLSITSVKFNGVEVSSFTVNGAQTQITTTVPATATTGPITVTNANGTGTSATNFGVLPEVDGFSPAFGAVGATVTITGKRLTGTTQVRFNGTSGTIATTFANVSATTVTANVPADARTGTICLTTPAGTACSASSFTVAPRITSFSPASALPGATISINGANLQNTSAITFSGAAAVLPLSVNTGGTTASVIVPNDAITGVVAITTPAGTGTSSTSFGVPPVVESFSPAAGGSPGQVVTITGKRFTGASVVKFNTTNAATFTVVNATTITAPVPSAATSGKITVTTPGGSGVSVDTFVIGPKISSFTPTKGDTGTTVTVSGGNFTGVTSVLFNGVPASSFSVVSSGTLTAVVPPGTSNGPITVSSPNGTITSTATFYLPPSISGFTPASGPPGTSVTITGTNLSGAIGVAFNGTAATFVIGSPTSITATVPGNATTGVITVTTPHSATGTATPFTVTAAPVPALTATIAGTTASITWTNAGTQYDLQRATSLTGGWTTLARLSTSNYTDPGLAPNTWYLYRLVRVSDSAVGPIDLATTFVFTNDPLVLRTTIIQALHITEIRNAVNMLRQVAGLAPATWTDPSLVGQPIKLVHLTELRTKLTEARTAFGLTTAFTDPAPTTALQAKAAHFQELRNAMK